MQDEGIIAIVALAISLIALVLTLNQLLIQVFTTADGYRRCAESVIGIWHTRRRRIWKWSEFRFETQYVTPQIVLFSPREVRDYQEEYGEVFLINGTGLNDDVCMELEHTVHQNYTYAPDQKRALVQAGVRKRNPTNINTKDVEKAAVPRKQSEPKAKQTKRPAKFESDLLVSWLRLLRELHALSYSYWPRDCKTCTTPKWDKIESGFVESDYNAEMEAEPYRLSNTARTDIGVIYRTWTWDFMPPDMVRPLAESNAGDIVVLAIRLGMEWRVLDTEFGKMQAYGNGFTLSATDVRGLGTVLRFSATGRHERFPRLIPSRAVDKMLCGIVPGDSDLVMVDFPVVDESRAVTSMGGNGGILSKIGVTDQQRDRMRKHNYAEVRNDTFMLLCPFLPIEGSAITSYYCPLFNAEPGVRGFRGIHSFWEGRVALLHGLRDRINDATTEPSLKEHLVNVLAKLELFEEQYGDDFYCRFARDTYIRNGKGWEAKLRCINDCREIFNWTTKFFIAKGFHELAADDLTRYVHLVAAHAHMADYAVEDTLAFMKNYPHDKSHKAIRERYGVTGEKGGFYFVHIVHEVGLHYIKHLHDDGHGISAYLRDRGINLSADETEAAWWTMHLRGITFNLSSWNISLPGEHVPSSFYGNKTPVWIT
ncbi:hypothetical protein P154DRAFT_567584 [Amniculicola lignicola CBS 123094]|uniref:Uncharacterized protein n=1 Tax=Amniculicola lignicola CBS 123094 TaxID=1392246 RepID=A0A6A5VZI3_9PLEO|nr:hypothetical protein P154DRAFT_567584 [Amniculicola lignicola CBS 123094]